MSKEVELGQNRQWKLSGEKFEVVDFRQSVVGDTAVGPKKVEIQYTSGATRITTVETVANNSVLV